MDIVGPVIHSICTLPARVFPDASSWMETRVQERASTNTIDVILVHDLSVSRLVQIRRCFGDKVSTAVLNLDVTLELHVRCAFDANRGQLAVLHMARRTAPGIVWARRVTWIAACVCACRRPVAFSSGHRRRRRDPLCCLNE